MQNDRIAALERMLEKRPDDPRAYFGLALEHEKGADWPATVAALQRYLELSEDQGNAWGRLGHALRQIGDDAKAQSAYRRGVEAARAHGHPSMAMEFEEILEDWD